MTSEFIYTPIKIPEKICDLLQISKDSVNTPYNIMNQITIYIRKNHLVNPKDRRQIICDNKLFNLLELDSDRIISYPELTKKVIHLIKKEHYI